MNPRRFTPFVVALTLLAVLCSGPAVAQPSADELPTHFLLLTGSPEPSTAGTSGVLMVPGTVIPVTDRPGDSGGTETVEALLASGRAATELAAKLRATMRLEDIQIQYSQGEVLEIDHPEELPSAVPGSAVRPEVTLLGLTDTLATYRVIFRDGNEQLSETTVSIPLGRRSVVGALDGEEAPYLFLVIEPPSTRPVTVDSDERITPPRRLQGPAPSYTEAARKEKIEGTVIVQVVIDETGRVSHTRVLKSLDPALDRATEETIGQWTFEPARLEGEPVSVFYNLTINYRLDHDKKASDDGSS